MHGGKTYNLNAGWAINKSRLKMTAYVVKIARRGIRNKHFYLIKLYLGMYVDDDDDQIPNSYSQVCGIPLGILRIKFENLTLFIIQTLSPDSWTMV